MNKKTLVFSPTFNEKNNVIKFINFFKLKYSKLDLLVIDDNSPDNTLLLLRLFSKDNNNIIVKKRKKKDGS